MEEIRERRDSEAAAWVAWLVLGACAGDLAVQLARDPPRAIVGAPIARAPPQLATASPRELRALPGIGERRAIAIAESRWQLSPDSRGRRLSSIHGIGPATEARVRAALDGADDVGTASQRIDRSGGTPSTVHSSVPHTSEDSGSRPPLLIPVGAAPERWEPPANRDP